MDQNNSPDRLIIRETYITEKEGAMMYTQLRKAVVAAGILDRSYGYYVALAVVIFGGFFLGLYYIIVLPLSLPLIVWSVIFAFFSVQIAGLIHDAGHRAICKSTRWNDFLGEFFAFLIAAGYQPWRLQHNEHHAHTNEEDEDPDLAVPLHAFTRKRFEQERGLWRLLRKYQVWFFYPLRTLVVFSRKLASLKYFKTETITPILIFEMCAWSFGIVWWFLLPFMIFPVAKALVVFLVVNFFMGWYMSNIFAPNHKGMPQLRKGTRMSFLEQQIRTSRNIKANWVTDFIYLGLNYQIEHHLFPNCPRNKLKLITPFVLDVCQKLNLEYTEVGILESNRIILSELNNIVQEVKKEESVFLTRS